MSLRIFNESTDSHPSNPSRHTALSTQTGLGAWLRDGLRRLARLWSARKGPGT